MTEIRLTRDEEETIDEAWQIVNKIYKMTNSSKVRAVRDAIENLCDNEGRIQQ